MCGPGQGQDRARRDERGQALLFALLALLIASMAAAFVAEDLSLRERALQVEGTRMHVRAILDGALADALARLEAHPTRALPPETRIGDGVGRVVRLSGKPIFILRVSATYKGREGAAEAQVLLSATLPPKVLWWRRTPTG
jgi:hypothetical protein